MTNYPDLSAIGTPFLFFGSDVSQRLSRHEAPRPRQTLQIGRQQRGRHQATAMQQVRVGQYLLRRAIPSDSPLVHQDHPAGVADRQVQVPLDRGCAPPSANDRYQGQAPDLGCYEPASPLPRYGPRPERKE